MFVFLYSLKTWIDSEYNFQIQVTQSNLHVVFTAFDMFCTREQKSTRDNGNNGPSDH